MRFSGAEKTETVAAMTFTPRKIQARGQRKVPAAGKSSSAKKQVLKRMPPIRLRRSMVEFVWRGVGGALANELSPGGGSAAAAGALRILLHEFVQFKPPSAALSRGRPASA